MEVADIIKPELEKIAKMAGGSATIFMEYCAGYEIERFNLSRAHLIVRDAETIRYNSVIVGGFEAAIDKFYRQYKTRNEILFRDFRGVV